MLSACVVIAFTVAVTGWPAMSSSKLGTASADAKLEAVPLSAEARASMAALSEHYREWSDDSPGDAMFGGVFIAAGETCCPRVLDRRSRTTPPAVIAQRRLAIMVFVHVVAL